MWFFFAFVVCVYIILWTKFFWKKHRQRINWNENYSHKNGRLKDKTNIHWLIPEVPVLQGEVKQVPHFTHIKLQQWLLYHDAVIPIRRLMVKFVKLNIQGSTIINWKNETKIFIWKKLNKLQKSRKLYWIQQVMINTIGNYICIPSKSEHYFTL